MRDRLYSSHSPLAQWSRLGLLTLAITLCILVPFGLWGNALDRFTPVWLTHADSAVLLALLGIALLVADVLLPIPSSVVGMALCWTLGPLWGGASMALGLTLSFAFGYGLGLIMPEQRLRQWVGPLLWDRVRHDAKHRALWWIAIARPLPVLAEMSALLAGVWRVPPAPAFLMSAVSSIAVASLYSASAWLGGSEPDMGLTVLTTMAIPTLAWVLHRVLLSRLRGRTASTTGNGNNLHD